MSQTNDADYTTADGMSDDDVVPDAVIWKLSEEVIEDPVKKTETRLRYWKTDPDLKIKIPENADYAIFYAADGVPDDGKPKVGTKRKMVEFDKNKAFFVPWKMYEYWKAWPNGGQISEAKPAQNFLGGYDISGKYNPNILYSNITGSESGILLWPDGSTPDLTVPAYFEAKFKQGQAWTDDVIQQLQKSGDTKWTIKRGQPTGVTFQEMEYLRLSEVTKSKVDGAATDLWKLNQLRKQKVDRDAIYILRGGMEALKAGRFLWSDPPKIYISGRDGTAKLVAMDRDALNWPRTGFWTTAYSTAVSDTSGGRPSRARNVKHIAQNPAKFFEMLFVLITEDRIDLSAFQALVRTTMENAGTSINQRATVISTAEHVKELKKTFNYKLSVSPFEDFETWITEESFISYLEAYPGRELPKNKAAALHPFTATEAIISDTDTSTSSSKKSTKKESAKKLKEMNVTTGETREQLSSVSSNTIAAASEKGRKTQPGQSAIMGGRSATFVASSYGWEYPEGIGGVTKGDFIWDKPGTVAAEWLHRTAWSWGDVRGPEQNSIQSNFVFGTSESNTLMIRYERSWQDLLQLEVSYQEARKKTGKEAEPIPRCNLYTGNTYRDEMSRPPFESLAMKIDGTTKSLGWVETQGALCFTLDYGIDLPRLLRKQFGLKATVFYPFQRGFYTRLEEAVDHALLVYWLNSAKAKFQPLVSSSKTANLTLNQKMNTIGNTPLTTSVDLPTHTVFNREPTQRFGGPQSFQGHGGPNSNNHGFQGHDAQNHGPPQQQQRPSFSVPQNNTGPGDPPHTSQGPVGQGQFDHGQPGQGQFGFGDHGHGDHRPGRPSEPPSRPSDRIPVQPDNPPPLEMPAQPLKLDISKIKVNLSGVDVITADAWLAVAKSKPLEIGGVTVAQPRIAVTDDAQPLIQLGVVRLDQSGDSANRQSITRLAISNISSNTTRAAPAINANTDLASSSNTAVLPENFTVTGPIKLFGLFDTQLYSFHGDKSSGIRQIVPLSSNNVKLSSFLPAFANTPLDDVNLRNTMFIYNQYTDAFNESGTWLSTEVIFRGSLQPVSEAMSSILGLKDPSVRFEIFLHDDINWLKPLLPTTLYLQGNIPDLSVKFGDIIEFSKLWIGINTGRKDNPTKPGTKMLVWSTRFSGEAHLTMPLSMSPLMLDFSVSYFKGMVHLQLDSSDGTVLTKFCGIDGVNLSELSLSIDFTLSSVPGKLSFTANATLELDESTLILGGRYSKDDWFLTCELANFDAGSLRSLYAELFNNELHPFEHDLVIDDLSLLLSSDGILIEGVLTIEGHTTLEASVSVSRLGIEITGAIEGDVATFEGVTLESARFDIFVGNASNTTAMSSGTSWKFQIVGTIDVYGAKISASAILGKDGNGKTTWIVYGEFDGAVNLKRLIPNDPPELRQALSIVPWLDLTLTQVAFMASNIDQTTVVGTSIPADYPVKMGVQILARLSGLPELDKAMNNSATTTGMKVRLAYGSGSSTFGVDIQLPSPQTTSMSGNSVSSGPIKLRIEFGGSEPVLLMARADFAFALPKPQLPLQFSGGLKIGVSSASMFLNMADGQMWNNPFGLCPQLALDPRLGLQIGIVYAPPSITGGVAGSFQFGDAVDGFTGQGAISVSELPNQELLQLKAGNIGIIKLAKFAASLLEQSIASPPEEFLLFKQVEFYLSTGVTIGTLVYPPGARFACDAELFGIRANIIAEINKTNNNLKINASLSSIHIGPLEVTGTSGSPNLQVAISISPSTQTILFDGRIKLLDLETFVYVNAELQPSPKFDLRTLLRFTDELTFQIGATTHGRTIGSMNQIQDFEFSIHAIMEQKICDFITKRLDEQIAAAKRAAEASIEDARGQLRTAKANYEGKIDEAEHTLQQAQGEFDARAKVLRQALSDAGALFTQVVGKLFEEWQKANRIFQEFCDKATNALQDANMAETLAVRGAMQKVSDAMAAADAGVDAALGDLGRANKDMDRQFGDANANLQQAQNTVDGCQGAVDRAQREFDNANRDLRDCEWYERLYYAGKAAVKGTALGSEKAGLKIAKGVLNGCSGFLNSVAYRAAQGAIDGASESLRNARTAGDRLVAVANQEVDRVTAEQDELVRKAGAALQKAKTDSDQLSTSQKAERDWKQKQSELQAGIDRAANDLANITKEAVGKALAIAKDGLEVAKGTTKALEVAEDSLEGMEELTDQILDAGDCVVNKGLNLLNIRTMEIDGDLRGVCNGSKLDIRIKGTVTNTEIDWMLHLSPGKGLDLIKELYDRILQEAKSGLTPLQHRPGWVRPISRREKSQTELRAALEKLPERYLKPGPEYVVAYWAQRAENALNSALVSTELTDPQFARIAEFLKLPNVKRSDLEALINSLPQPAVAVETRVWQLLSAAQDILMNVTPFHPKTALFESFPGSWIDHNEADKRVVARIERSWQAQRGLTMVQIESLEKFVGLYDGIHANTLHIDLILNTGI